MSFPSSYACGTCGSPSLVLTCRANASSNSYVWRVACGRGHEVLPMPAMTITIDPFETEIRTEEPEMPLTDAGREHVLNVAAHATQEVREAWTGKEYPVLMGVLPETIRMHMKHWHGWIPDLKERPDNRTDEELILRHNNMHAHYRDGLVDAHFHLDIEPRWAPPREPEFPEAPVVEGRIAEGEVVVAEGEYRIAGQDDVNDRYRKLASEWHHLMEQAVLGMSDDFAEFGAFRFVMVNVFGSQEEYVYDPEFKAKVSLAVQMLKQFADVVRTGRIPRPVPEEVLNELVKQPLLDRGFFGPTGAR